MNFWPFKRRKKRLQVGDVLPEGSLPDGNIGAFIAIDPETRIITAIFIP